MAHTSDASPNDHADASASRVAVDIQLDRLREALAATEPEWPGWDTIDAWLADVGQLAVARREAREAPRHRCREDWARACTAAMLGELWEGTPPLIPDSWRGDVVAATALHDELVELLAQGPQALAIHRDAHGPTARRDASSRLAEIERGLSRVMVDMRRLLDGVDHLRGLPVGGIPGGVESHPGDALAEVPREEPSLVATPEAPDGAADQEPVQAPAPTHAGDRPTATNEPAPPGDAGAGPTEEAALATGPTATAAAPEADRGVPDARLEDDTVDLDPLGELDEKAEGSEAFGHSGTHAESVPPLPSSSPDAVGDGTDASTATVTHSALTPPAVSMPPPLSASSATASPVAPITFVSGELCSYDAFREAFWTAPGGQCAPVPWRDPAFADELRSKTEELLAEESPDLRWLWLMSRAGEQLGVSALVSPDDVRALDALQHAPEAPEAGASSERGPRLQEAVREGAITSAAAWRWRLLLEVLRPHREAPLSWEMVQDGCEAAGIPAGPLQDLLVGLATLNVGGEDGTAVVRAALRDRPGDPAAIAQELTSARQAYYSNLIARWNAGGGYIMTTHCRRAWGIFMDTAGANLKRLYPVAHGGLEHVDVACERTWVNELPRVHARIADREGAKFKDRARMDRLVERFQADATHVLDLARRLQTAQADRVARPELSRILPAIAQLCALIDARLSAASAEQASTEPAAMRALAAFALGCLGARSVSGARGDSAEFDDADIRRYPGLLRLLGPGVSPGASGGPALRFDVVEITDPRRAAAIVLKAPPQDLPDLPSLVRWLEARGEHLLMGPLLPALGTSDQHRMHVRRQQALEHLGRLADELDAIRYQLGELAHPAGPAWREVVESARRLLQEPARLPGDPTLVQRWLEQSIATAQRAQDDAVRDLRTQAAARDGALRDAIGGALNDRRYADALRMLGDHAVPEEGTRPRETPWRWEARRLYPDPREAITRFTEHTDFVQIWRAGIQEKNQRLRTLFRNVMFQGLDVPSDAQHLRIARDQVRTWLARQRQNPSGLSQLADCGGLVVLTPPHPPHHANFVPAVAEQVSAYAGDLVAVLTPRLAPEVRPRVLAAFRERRCKAAVVDDLDLCRLLNPGGARPVPVVALLELILEQQRWSDVSPFRLADGQSVRVEMYFGRADEARKLSREGQFSRLFSGRRLGKSALLRFVEQTTQDGEPLPSGLRLRVVYVSAAGIDAERTMVEAILRALEERCPTGVTPEAPDVEPADRLERTLRRHLAEHPNESLLFFLDEADVFVEQQLRLYVERAEGILSFAMRSRLESILDSAGLQRVRFVFTGYRVTNTTRGAWGNWGDVLRLRPLDPQDAADLIVRPLARLGIDARPQAQSIAYRCGYQPAVLLRFGEQLLAHLEGLHPPHRRDQAPVQVSPDDVAAVFDGDRVRTEIVQVVRNNFQGNDVGEVVHAVVLLEFLGLPPGRPLVDAGAAVLRNLQRLSDGDLRWFTPEGSTPEAEVAHHLRDLVARELLVSRREGTGEVHTLRFPHLLPVLLHLADVREVRERIQTLRGKAAATPGSAAIEGALPERDLEELRAYLHPGEESVAGLRVIPIVASHWSTPLVDDRVGLAERLGLLPPAVLHADPPARLPPRLPDGPSLLLSVEARNLADVLGRLPVEGVPALVGGVDLLRWALGAEGLTEDTIVEAFSDGRWSRPRVAWWFQRVRALEFERPGALDQLYARTSGIPLLLACFDQTLRDSLGLTDGETVSGADWQRALDAFEAALPGVARALTGTSAATALLSREVEILRMLALVREAKDPAEVREHLTDLWPVYQDELAVKPISPEEWPLVGLLQRLGLVPVAPRRGRPEERLQRLPADDALHGLLARLPR